MKVFTSEVKKYRDSVDSTGPIIKCQFEVGQMPQHPGRWIVFQVDLEVEDFPKGRNVTPVFHYKNKADAIAKAQQEAAA